MDKLRLTPGVVKELRAMLKENSVGKLVGGAVSVGLIFLAMRAPEVIRALAELIR